MTKQHYISFIAALSADTLQLVKLYPEGDAAARVAMRGVEKIFYYCNRDGLFCTAVHPAIDGQDSSYDRTAVRRALEETAGRLIK